MRGVWIVIVVSACEFSPGGGLVGHDGSASIDDVRADSPGSIDARPDGTPAPPCHVGVASATGTDRGRVGGGGGSVNFPALACDNPLDRMVGIALRMSNQDTVFGGRSAYALQVACATVTVDPAGVGVTGTPYTHELTALGGGGWTPSTLTAITQCQPGWILSGMSAYTGTGANRLLNVSITCAKIDVLGAISTTEVIAVAGSLTDTNNLTTATCNAGEVVVQMPNHSGLGVDSVNLSCAALTCQ